MSAVITPEVVTGPTWFELSFPQGSPRRSAFHYRWLRHHAEEERHPTTGERLLCSSELPDDLTPLAHRIVEGPAGLRLAVDWSDARTTVHDLDWLQQHAYASEGEIPGTPDVSAGRYEVLRGTSLDAPMTDEIRRRLADDGLCIVRAPAGAAQPEAETEAWIAAFERAGLRVIATHFGRIEDLRPDNTTNANNDQLGYTDAPIQLHTDQPFLDEPPRFQLLQSVVAADEGGDNVFVDAERASHDFAAVAAHEHALLTTLPVRFSRKQKHFEREVVSPILRPASAGTPFRVRYSYFTLAPLSFPFAMMASFYRAHDAFARMLRDPARGVRVRLQPGDVAIYDNHRMLHARTSFRGSRWVRGVYFDVQPT